MMCVRGKKLAAVAVAVAGLSTVAFAQGATQYLNVPFKVNVDATVTAVQSDSTVSIEVTKDVQKNLRLPLQVNIATSVRNTGRTQGQLNTPIVTGSRGNISLRLPAQSYSNAEVALHAVNGKRILRGKANAKDAVSGVSRKNVAAGVYMLSVKGADGSMFTTRLTHSGGKMNINVAFGAESVSPSPSPMRKQAADGDWYWTWDITVSAEGYYDSAYTIDLQYLLGQGYDILPTQNITLTESPLFTDRRDGKTYKKIKIGEQVWMAENLNYREDEEGNVLGVCYNNMADSCAKYGRLYDWGTAMGLEDSYYGTVWGGSDVNHQGVCPAGWHLPSNAEWDVLMTAVGGASTAARKLKSQSGWYNCGPAGSGNSYVCEDAYGFSALSGGVGNPGGYFDNAGNNGIWWSATESNAFNAYYRSMNYYNEYVLMDNVIKTYKFSVRCVQD